MKNITRIAALTLFLSGDAFGQDESLFPKGEKAPNVHHTGNVWLSELSQADANFNYNVTYATFEPGAKLNWHIHPGGQILMITEGKGYYQERGKPIEIVQKGDVIKCLPNVEHWHASTPTNSFAYVATTTNHEKGRTIWLEEVTEKEYLLIEKK